MNENTTKAIKVLVIILAVIVGGILAFAYIGDYFGLPIATAIREWIEMNYPSLISGSTFAGLVAGIRVLMVIMHKNDLSLKDILMIRKDVEHTNKEAKTTNEKLLNVITTFAEEIKELKAFKESQSKDMQEIKANEKDIMESQKTLTDINLLYAFKNSSDKVIEEFYTAYGESELLKNIRKLQEIKETKTLTPKEEKKVDTMLNAAENVIIEAKKRVRL